MYHSRNLDRLVKAFFVCPMMFVAMQANAQSESPPLPLKQGKWLGYFVPPSTQGAIGVSLDLFQAQPNDLREFPRLEGLLRLSLGGIGTLERSNTHFTNINYNFTTGELTFDEEGSDFVVRAKVVERNRIEGTVTHATAGDEAKLALWFIDPEVSSEPCDPDEECPEPPDLLREVPKGIFLPHLSGTYLGKCNSAPARLDLFTRPASGETENAGFLKEYSIQGRLGLTSSQCEQGKYCVFGSFDSGLFDLFSGRLSLSSAQGEQECSYTREGALQCRMTIQGTTQQNCTFRNTTSREETFTRKTLQTLAPPADAMEPLPAQGAELEPLRKALHGNYAGFVFHEHGGSSQPLRLDVVASTSTDNPHNEPNVYITSSLRLFHGPQSSAPPASFSLGRRTFFSGKGLTLRSESSDLLLVIDQWTSGLLRGTLYSRAFGRVGPVQLVKGRTAFTPAQTSPSLATRYVPKGGKGWSLDLRVLQSENAHAGHIPLAGYAQFLTPGFAFPKQKVTDATFDPFSQSLWLTIHDSEGTERQAYATVQPSGELRLQVGSSSAWFVTMPPAEPTVLAPARQGD